MQDLKLLFFDHDGTLIDSLDDVLLAANLASEGLTNTRIILRRETIETIDSITFPSLRKSAGVPNNNHPAFERRMIAHLKETQPKLFPGIREFLPAAAEKYELAVITANDKATAQKALAREKCLEHFQMLIRGKHPHAKAWRIQETCNHRNIMPSNAALVGDTAGDIQAAREAGAISIGVTWGYQPQLVKQEKPDYLAGTPEHLADILGIRTR